MTTSPKKARHGPAGVISQIIADIDAEHVAWAALLSRLAAPELVLPG